MLSSEISVEQLKQKITQQNLIVLYTSMDNMTAAKHQLVRKHPQSYIPSSCFFDFQYVIVDHNSALSNTMPPIDVFEHEVRRLGINNDSEIVVYDDFGNFCASRVWFMFKSMGHDNIKVLAGGLASWLDADLATHNKLVTSADSGHFTAYPNLAYQFVDSSFVTEHVVNPDEHELSLLDARSSDRFSGEAAEQRQGLRSGHIPNSFNLHYQRLQDKTGAYLPLAELKQIFESANPNPKLLTSPMGFTCGSGVTACILAQAADSLGIGPLYVYDGSWSDWGQHESLPISMGQ